jgi:hypothetical protein
MSREANMEMERSKREHEYNQKFGKIREHSPSSDWNEKLLKRLRHEGIKEHEHLYWEGAE